MKKDETYMVIALVVKYNHKKHPEYKDVLKLFDWAAKHHFTKRAEKHRSITNEENWSIANRSRWKTTKEFLDNDKLKLMFFPVWPLKKIEQLLGHKFNKEKK